MLQVVWRPIIWGFALQFLFAILVLRWTFGYEVIKFISVQVTTFVEYAYDGAATVFGNPTLMFHPFSMMVSNTEFELHVFAIIIPTWRVIIQVRLVRISLIHALERVAVYLIQRHMLRV